MIPFDSKNIIEALTRQIPGSLITPDKLIPGKFSRFSTNGKTGDRSGYIKIYPDGEGAVFGCMRQQIKGSWQIRAARTPEEKKAFQEQIRQAQEEAALILSAAQEERSRLSTELFLTLPLASPDHAYLKEKKISPHGAKQDDNGNLIVFVYGPDGKIHGHQIIKPDGSKMFAPDTAKKGHYFVIGKPKGKILLAEGFATSATIHEATGQAVACAFDAGNLGAVARVLRAKYPEIQIIICSDDDHRTEGNPGITKATEAARAVNGLLAVPSFSGERGDKDTDFNDLMKLEGIEAVKIQVEKVINQKQQPRGKFQLVRFGEIKLRNISWLIKGYIEEGSMNLAIGDPGSGKSFLAVDWACRIATGTDFYGSSVKAGAVVYIAGEGNNGLTRRFTAWAIRNNIKLESAPVYISNMPAQLTDQEQISGRF
ncbi:AAA family ATPase [Desulforegula conservatrix]|uniref:AAA family ATPase n=1 Tax=Desulforegula conservatrix TaxID=153026 RepID=UPI0004030987|nr:AAA family ATPase [Desulforegula conservatrix]